MTNAKDMLHAGIGISLLSGLTVAGTTGTLEGFLVGFGLPAILFLIGMAEIALTSEKHIKSLKEDYFELNDQLANEQRKCASIRKELDSYK